MCGIAGFSISDKDHRLINCRRLACALARQIQQRGTDATGIAWTQTDEDGDLGVWYMKDHVSADEFIVSMDQVAKYTRQALIHTRYATKGSPMNNHNNHPIVVGDTVGIHNGTVRNDDEIIAMVGTGRTGQVDTEAIFRLIDASSDPVGNLEMLEGSAAIGWFNTKDPSLVNLARVRTSPLFIGQTEGGSMVFASTEALLRSACTQAGVKLSTVKQVPEGMYLSFRHGEVEDVRFIGEKEKATA